MPITTLAAQPEATTVGDGVVHPAAMSTSRALAMARADIHDAVRAIGDHHRCRQHAISARDNAIEVLTDPNSTAAERDYAGFYLADAQGILAQLDDTNA